ncbi:MAG TPA: hypothetical protein VGB07_20150, partial [Blastocatellia bacterium]
MPLKDNQQEGTKPSPGQPANGLQPEIVGAEAEAESLSVELKKPGDDEFARRPKKRRTTTRWVVLLLFAGLAVVGYTQRARVPSFFKAQT